MYIYLREQCYLTVGFFYNGFDLLRHNYTVRSWRHIGQKYIIGIRLYDINGKKGYFLWGGGVNLIVCMLSTADAVIVKTRTDNDLCGCATVDMMRWKYYNGACLRQLKAWWRRWETCDGLIVKRLRKIDFVFCCYIVIMTIAPYRNYLIGMIKPLFKQRWGT